MSRPITRIAGSVALGTIIMTGATFAQTDATGYSTTDVTAASGTAGIPNTGAGGGLAASALLLGGSAMAFAAAAYAMRSRYV